MADETHSIEYGSLIIPFTLTRTKRRTLGIHVYPDLSVKVVAPKGAPLKWILKTAHKRAPWILKKRQHFETFLPPVPPRQYISGETHRYLGRQYRLKVLENGPRSVKLLRGQIHVSTNGNSSNDTVKKLLEGWFRDRAKEVLADRVDACLESLHKYEISQPVIANRRMKTRWGSCSTAGRVTLNTELIHVPKQCIDYVVTHELCHLKEHNHSPDFYRMLESVMPDWQQRREKLNWYASR